MVEGFVGVLVLAVVTGLVVLGVLWCIFHVLGFLLTGVVLAATVFMAVGVVALAGVALAGALFLLPMLMIPLLPVAGAVALLWWLFFRGSRARTA